MTLQVRLNLAQGGIYGLFAIAIGVMGVLTCVRARRRSDPARIAFTWLKVAFTLAALCVHPSRSSIYQPVH